VSAVRLALAGVITIVVGSSVLPLALGKETGGRKKQKGQSEALEALCDLAADRKQDLAEIDRAKMDECGSSPMSPGVQECYQEYENQKFSVIRRYEARTARFQEKAEKQLKRKVNDDDCCDALPSRFQRFGNRCIAAR
jgi:hypothetical protein